MSGFSYGLLLVLVEIRWRVADNKVTGKEVHHEPVYVTQLTVR